VRLSTAPLRFGCVLGGVCFTKKYGRRSEELAEQFGNGWKRRLPARPADEASMVLREELFISSRFPRSLLAGGRYQENSLCSGRGTAGGRAVSGLISEQP
jgi:hypothetical protein